MEVKDEEYIEDVRRLTLCGGYPTKSEVFYNGWSQVMAIRYLFDKYSTHISPELLEITKEIFKISESFSTKTNVRKLVKRFLMYPHTEFPPFLDHTDPEMLKIIQNNLNGKRHVIKVVCNKLYCMLPPFNHEMQKLTNNFEDPHITLVNSPDFKDEYHKYDGLEINDLTYTKLMTSRALEYPPFDKIIVVQATSQTLENLMMQIGNKCSLHFTIKIIYRQMYEF